MAEDDLTPTNVCVICGEPIEQGDAVAETAYHEGGEVMGLVWRHSSCEWPESAS